MGLFSRKKPQKRVEIYELIFCPSGNQEDILSELERAFALQGGGTGDQITLSQNDMILAFTVHTATDEDGDYATEQLQGVWNYFRQVETEHLEVQRNLLHHLRMCRGVIQIHASYDGPENPEKENAIQAQIWKAALPLQGLLTRGSDVLCDAMGRPIFDKQGHSELTSYMPPQYPLPDEWKQNAPEDCHRRADSLRQLEEKRIYAPSFLPLLDRREAEPGRSLREVCGRAAALLVTAVYSECRLGEQMPYEEAKAFVQPIADAYGAEEFFSPAEREYLENPDSSQQEQIQFVWQYETLWVMEWALGLNEDLFWPDHICDVPASVQLMNEHSDLDALMSAAKLRNQRELLDQADLSYLLHWACVDAQIVGLPAPQELDGGVVMERRKALFWLAGCDDCCGWDEVDLST